MADEKLSVNAESVTAKPDNNGKLSLEVNLPVDAELIVCQVCGHKNAKNACMCVMCSNYLFD